ncbi:uncharacterized protein LOC110116056 [Dendrobium catenatum]|uniref:uncharacterized protein LOC110116056 n=1 Tax=Dendrobium catenatum TaxID=906689 RepID=UPI0009F5C723|nr:uncharacterized protein LOC110116056 [Dendrobium catenatum]
MSSSSSSRTMDQTTSNPAEIPSSLKLVLSHIKTIVPTSLSSDNYPIWKSQILKLLRANGFDSHIDIATAPPPRLLQQTNGSKTPNPAYLQWQLIDQNLVVALCSTISPSIIPYVLIWIDVMKFGILWSNNFRLRITPELFTAGSNIDSEDIVLYILNGLPPSYQAFKTAIRTKRGPLSLDELYSYLLTEEINLATETSRQHSTSDPNTALYASRGHGRRGRGRSFNSH